MKKNCVICGKEGYSYFPFCYKHLQMKNEGKIIKCEDCGEWHFIDEPCQCNSKPQYTELPTEGFNACVACGARTSGYAFCRKCFNKYTEEEMLNMLNESKVESSSIEEDDEIEETVAPQEKKETTSDNDPESNNVVVIDLNSKSKCITCGKQTGGLLFCTSCYHKYKNKELLFRITNCTNVELLDEDYEGRYTCKDGHIVKSKSERDIDNYLFEHGISHAYERELPYGATEKEVLHPDFYLPNYLGEGKHVYIEHWGYNENNIQYTKTKKFKMPIYRKLGITLICTYEKTDMGKIDTVLDRKLNKTFIEVNKINYEETLTEEKREKQKIKQYDDLPF